MIPAGLLVLACAKRFEPASQAVVNGQFLLVRRKAYFALGGHCEVRGEICEDTALAARIRGQGFVLQILAAPDLARTRMYRDLVSLWEGFAKNAVDILGSAAQTLIVAASVLVFAWIGLLLPVWALAAAVAAPTAANAAGGILGTRHLDRGRLSFRHSTPSCIPGILGLTFVIGYTAVASLARYSVITGSLGGSRGGVSLPADQKRAGPRLYGEPDAPLRRPLRAMSLFWFTGVPRCTARAATPRLRGPDCKIWGWRWLGRGDKPKRRICADSRCRDVIVEVRARAR